MKKFLAVLLTLALLCGMGFAEHELPEKPMGEMGGNPPELPEGEMGGNQPEKPMGEIGGNPPELPEGEMNGAPMGMSQAPESYAAVNEIESDAELGGDIVSEGKDENAILVQSGTATVKNANILRTSSESSGGDEASFYGVGAAILALGGTVDVENSTISTDAAGGAGVFAYGDGVAYVSDTTITTKQNTSGGIHVAGGGTLYAANLTVSTEGESAAAIRSDRGGGSMTVEGGSYTTGGVGSPAVYVTADISIRDAVLTANASEALCLEGLNSVRLYDCALSGNMQDLAQNDNTWTVIVYQSMSGDSQIGKGSFEMSGGTLSAENGGVFYTTNTQSEFVLSGVEIEAAQDSEYFLRATGNQNQRGWGRSGENGAQCVFTGIGQQMNGDVIWDSISTLRLYLTDGSALTGAVLDDESCAGSGGDGYCDLYIDEHSRWVVTGDSTLNALYCEGDIVDAQGNAVAVLSPNGTVLRAGESAYSVTVNSFKTECDLSGAGAVSA